MVMVTTHDLALANAEDLAACCMSVHFDGSVERVESGVRLSFDYVLRPGLATSTNAIALMDSLGLGVTERDAQVGDPSGDTS